MAITTKTCKTGNNSATAQRFKTGLLISGFLVSAITVFTGCAQLPPIDNGSDPTPNPPTNPQPEPTPPIASINKNSIVIHSPSDLAVPFSFRKTMNQIAHSLGGNSSSVDIMLQDMIDSFGETSFDHPVSGKNIPVTHRGGETQLTPAALLNPSSADGMRPVGIFNRFDLAPADGSNCGEHRIVYAKNTGNIQDRLTIIFEARVPNPSPMQGLAGCKTITDFWAKRSGDSDINKSVSELEKFYYQGVDGIPPVVDAMNYGLPLGQIRSNLFMTDRFPNNWALREHLVSFDSNGNLTLKAEPVDDSPISTLFGNRVLPADFNNVERKNFQQTFADENLCNLVAPELINNNASPAEVVTGIGAGFDSRFNDFESVSQGSVDDPASTPSTDMTNAINTRLSELGLSGKINSSQLLNRAGAMTCGGCHQFSNSKPLGNNTSWPSSLGFVHIDEAGSLSPLLTTSFIPARTSIAQRFLESPSPFQPQAGSCGTNADTESREITSATASSNQYRGAPLYADVDRILNSLLSSARAESAQPAILRSTLTELETTIKRSRNLEKSNTGAFTKTRRTH